jgi:hypothetical protein
VGFSLSDDEYLRCGIIWVVGAVKFCRQNGEKETKLEKCGSVLDLEFKQHLYNLLLDYSLHSSVPFGLPPTFHSPNILNTLLAALKQISAQLPSPTLLFPLTLQTTLALPHWQNARNTGRTRASLYHSSLSPQHWFRYFRSG